VLVLAVFAIRRRKPEMPKRIEVDLSRQVLLAFDGPKQVFSFDCVTGDDSHPTPSGRWHIRSKHRHYTNHKYHVRMNFAMFFTTTGEAIHESSFVGPLSYLKSLDMGFIGSHGCVRLASEDAEALFQWTPIGTNVRVH
jgi:lipoprotein-anchoring transpeptidase ErfK/SrfK